MTAFRYSENRAHFFLNFGDSLHAFFEKENSHEFRMGSFDMMGYSDDELRKFMIFIMTTDRYIYIYISFRAATFRIKIYAQVIMDKEMNRLIHLMVKETSR